MVSSACILMKEDETLKTVKVNNILIKKTVQEEHTRISS